jgi:sporulation protein YlmC with PRC-barrel domain
MRLSEFLKLEVVSVNGRHLGHVVELRCAGEPEHGNPRQERVISEFLFGRFGWLERLGLKAVNEQKVPWESVLAIRDGKILIRRTED